MTTEQYDALRDVIDYLWSEEEKNFNEGRVTESYGKNTGNHIYTSLVSLKEFVDNAVRNENVNGSYWRLNGV